MKVRILSGVGIAVVMIALFLLNPIVPYLMYFFVDSLIFVGIYEVLNTAKLAKKYQLLIPCEIAGLSVPWLMMSDYLAAGMLAFALVMFAVMLFSYDSIKFSEIAYCAVTTLMIAFGLGSVAGLSVIRGRDFANLLVFTVMFIPWGADIGGYFTGVFLGKHKLCPKVSPKKTVEGFIGSLVFGTAFPVLYAYLYLRLSNIGVEYTVDYIALCGISLCCVLVSVLGDLTFSIIKRNYGIKDYGNLIPGHGGILDRFDSVIFVAPTMLILFSVYPFFLI